MGEISGKDLVIEFGGTDISGKARSYEIAEDKGETAKIDVSHKGDTSVQQIEGLQISAATHLRDLTRPGSVSSRSKSSSHGCVNG